MTFILVDLQNMFWRARHVVRSGDPSLKVGMAFHILFSSIAKTYRDFNGSHVVFCLEGRSWRKDFYLPYKRNRSILREQMSSSEKEEEQMFYSAFNDLSNYLTKETLCTVLHNSQCEADDFISRWITNHPNDKHIIISTDSDFYQLLNENVSQYNGVTNQHITINGIYDDRGKPVLDKNTKEIKQIGNPEWLLFEKCIRGDTSDNIFSAYPGARIKGSKNKVGMTEAFEDRNTKGYNWNNFMLQRWSDHEGNEHIVLNDYNRNRKLIDLTLQPDDIKNQLDQTIIESIEKNNDITQIGVKFLKFCGKFGLDKISNKPNEHIAYLNASYAKDDK